MGAKTPPPLGPASIELSALGALETPADDGPVETSVVDPADDGALVDELPVPPLVVVETASCADADSAQAANPISASNEVGNRLIVPAAPFEPRPQQETSNRIVIEARPK